MRTALHRILRWRRSSTTTNAITAPAITRRAEQPNMKSQRGIMTTDRLLSYANGAYLLCVIFAALFSVVLWRLSIQASEEANVQISAANARAAEADRRSADAGRDAAHALERAAALEKGASEANERTVQAEERIANLNAQIRKMITPRIIPEQEKPYLIAAMREETGASFIGASTPGDPEALYLLISIMKILQEAGWEGKDWSMGGLVSATPGYPTTGQTTSQNVILLYHTDGDARIVRGVHVIGAALQKYGIAANPQPITPEDRSNSSGFSDRNAMYVLVGKKNF